NANSVILGRNVNGIDNPFATGTLNLHGGDFNASSIVMGQDESPTGRNDRARGVINLTAGTLNAATIASGSGEAVFNWTGGTLHVGTFGSADKPIALTQNGGTLAPGNSVGAATIFGDYTQAAAGTLQIEIAGTGDGGTDFDLVEVYGNTLLDGWLEVSLLDSFVPELGDHFDVLHTSGTLGIANLRISGDPPSPIFGWWQVDTVLGPGGEGLTLRLSAVPEPSSFVLVGFGLLGLLWWRGGRNRRPV
ncbi:MAG: PEP-CTERM sorting domain-containing protein, partial [Patescibacteria group bacterium]|nr:PEP-CTERM sorting domain-containing protein [Patescibacteria group bacterium]